MEAIAHKGRGATPFLLALAGLLVTAGVAWLWMRHGLDVYLTQMAQFVMTCF